MALQSRAYGAHNEEIKVPMSVQECFPRRIWMYWENRPFSRKPPYLELCLETIERHRGDYEIFLLNEKTVREYIDVPKKVQQLEEIAHKADYIRFHLLERYGGVWLDADIILLRNIAESIEPFISDNDFVGYGREYGKPSINFMACRPHCRLMKSQVDAISETLDQKRKKFFKRKIKLQWTAIGHDLLWDFAKDYSYYHHEMKSVAPVFWSDWEVFFRRDISVESYLSENPYMFMLYNDFMYKPLKDLSAQNILEDDMLISKIFRYALH